MIMPLRGYAVKDGDPFGVALELIDARLEGEPINPFRVIRVCRECDCRCDIVLLLVFGALWKPYGVLTEDGEMRVAIALVEEAGEQDLQVRVV